MGRTAVGAGGLGVVKVPTGRIKSRAHIMISGVTPERIIQKAATKTLTEEMKQSNFKNCLICQGAAKEE